MEGQTSVVDTQFIHHLHGVGFFAERYPGVAEIHVRGRAGDPVPIDLSFRKVVVQIIASGSNPEQAFSNGSAARAAIRIVTV